MSSVHHHDESRSKVGSTAFGVAKAREIETNQPNGLIKDPYAKYFLTKEVDDFLESFSQDRKDSMITGIAVRTRKIDEIMAASLPNIHQIVLLGAGLDSRAWRLQSYLSPEEQTIYKTIKFFEIDFQELFDFKLTQLSEQKPYFDYHAIVANVCVDKWIDVLIAKGFDPSKPTFWLLEGFTGYLTSEELGICLTNIQQASSKGSKLIATFLGDSFDSFTKMHRFRTDTPGDYLSTWGWKGQTYDMVQLCESFGRSSIHWEGYYLVDMTL